MEYIPAERHQRIRDILATQGVVRVSTLSSLFGVSEMTIRRDLEFLEKEGILERTHGGAIQSRRMRTEPLYAEKGRIHSEEKRAIGATAAQFVQDGETILVNSGSTTLQVVRHLVGQRRALVVTSNVGAVLEAVNSDVEVLLIGGTYRPQSNSLVGPFAIRSLQQVYGSKCFIGVDGISVKYGLTTPSLLEAEVARTMIERTRGEVIVVADHSKLGVVADFISAPLEKVNILVVDDGIADDYRLDLERVGIRVVIAPTSRSKAMEGFTFGQEK
jgi:DeoR family fructose operon transcriptional repressor